MLTIAGNGMGPYDFAHLAISLDRYDIILCDPHCTHPDPRILRCSYTEAHAYILEHYRDQELLYVVTGSPLFYSAGTLIANSLPPQQVRIIDNTSSKSYLLSRLMIAAQHVAVLSLHGRTRIDLEQFLQKEYTLILCDRHSIHRLQTATQYLEHDALRIIIGYKLGYTDEQIVALASFREAEQFDLTQPYVLLLQRTYIPLPSYREDDAFVTERGMITKRYKRHLSLQHLDLAPNHILWDVGAGSGSCAIEAHSRYRVKTVLFENKPQRIENIRKNLRTHHVCDAQLIAGNAAINFVHVADAPDRIFIGGGGTEVIEKLPDMYARLTPNGILLIVAVTLASLTRAIQTLRDAGITYHVIALALTTYKGTWDMAEPERQLFQIKVIKR